MKKKYIQPLVEATDTLAMNTYLVTVSLDGTQGGPGVGGSTETDEITEADAKNRFGNEMEMAVDAERQYGDLWQ